MRQLILGCVGLLVAHCAIAADAPVPPEVPELPDPLLVEAYERAAVQNVLAAVNPLVFHGYFSVCADGQGFGYGCSYPSLDGHQMTDALLWLGQVDTVKANFAYVRTFQRPNGQLPLAILPPSAGQLIGPVGSQSPVDPNGGLYAHWVRGDPLRALAGPTYVQNADVIYRRTLDRQWLMDVLPSVNLAADYLASLVNEQGGVGGAGYYIERPTRIEHDGVAQCHAADAFRRVAALNTVAGDRAAAGRYADLAARITTHFQSRFWVTGHFGEYLHPQRGLIATHGLTDVDWSAIALEMATPEQIALLWPKLKDEERFHFGGMPTGISTLPETYEDWEFSHPDKMDLAAMGRVWYLEAGARARMGDGQGLVASVRKVCEAGRNGGYYWRERYTAKGPHGVEKYCEYPANLIRIVQRFLLGVEFRVDGSLVIAPTVPHEYWTAGFGQTLNWRSRTLSYRFQGESLTGDYRGDGPQRLEVRFARAPANATATVKVDGQLVAAQKEDDRVVVQLPSATNEPRHFELSFPTAQ